MVLPGQIQSFQTLQRGRIQQVAPRLGLAGFQAGLNDLDVGGIHRHRNGTHGLHRSNQPLHRRLLLIQFKGHLVHIEIEEVNARRQLPFHQVAEITEPPFRPGSARLGRQDSDFHMLDPSLLVILGLLDRFRDGQETGLSPGVPVDDRFHAGGILDDALPLPQQDPGRVDILADGRELKLVPIPVHLKVSPPSLTRSLDTFCKDRLPSAPGRSYFEGLRVRTLPGREASRPSSEAAWWSRPRKVLAQALVPLRAPLRKTTERSSMPSSSP